MEPEIPKDSRILVDKIFEKNLGEIRKFLGPFLRSSNTIYSFKSVQNSLFEFKKHNNHTLRLKLVDNTLNFKNIFDENSKRFEILRIINIAIKQRLLQNKYLELGYDRKYYDQMNITIDSEIEKIGDFKLKFLRGYKTTASIYNDSIGTHGFTKVPKMLIDCCTRVLRVYNLWEEYLWAKKKYHNFSNFKFVDKIVAGKSFLTNYGNQRIYKVDHIDKKVTL